MRKKRLPIYRPYVKERTFSIASLSKRGDDYVK